MANVEFFTHQCVDWDFCVVLRPFNGILAGGKYA